MALLLAVSSWTSDRPSSWVAGETDEAAGILTAAGWRVVSVTADMPLGAAWEVLNRSYQTRSQPSQQREAERKRQHPAIKSDSTGARQLLAHQLHDESGPVVGKDQP